MNTIEKAQQIIENIALEAKKLDTIADNMAEEYNSTPYEFKDTEQGEQMRINAEKTNEFCNQLHMLLVQFDIK